MNIHRTTSELMPAASLIEIETEVSDVLDTLNNLNLDSSDGLLFQISEAIKGLAWAVGSLARHHENLAVQAGERRA